MNDNKMKKTIGQRINTLLGENGISQKELADELGVSANLISYYCKGDRAPDYNKLIAIAKFFKVTTDYLLGVSEEQTNDIGIINACEYTGLSEDAINSLYNAGETADWIRYLLEDDTDLSDFNCAMQELYYRVNQAIYAKESREELLRKKDILEKAYRKYNIDNMLDEYKRLYFYFEEQFEDKIRSSNKPVQDWVISISEDNDFLNKKDIADKINRFVEIVSFYKTYYPNFHPDKYARESLDVLINYDIINGHMSSLERGKGGAQIGIMNFFTDFVIKHKDYDYSSELFKHVIVHPYIQSITLKKYGLDADYVFDYDADDNDEEPNDEDLPF